MRRESREENHRMNNNITYGVNMKKNLIEQHSAETTICHTASFMLMMPLDSVIIVYNRRNEWTEAEKKHNHSFSFLLFGGFFSAPGKSWIGCTSTSATVNKKRFIENWPNQINKNQRYIVCESIIFWWSRVFPPIFFVFIFLFSTFFQRIFWHMTEIKRSSWLA